MRSLVELDSPLDLLAVASTIVGRHLGDGCLNRIGQLAGLASM